MRTTNPNKMQKEFSSLFNWKDIYQWKRVVSIGNTEKISEMILEKFDKIEWSEIGLRKKNYRIESHNGYSRIKSSIEDFREKRFCIALYNEFSQKQHPLLGKILDYEVPLTAPNQDMRNKINQGNIDLISIINNNLLFIEAKKAESTESLLKAILEIFVYTIRLSKFDLVKQLKNEYNISTKKNIATVLVFKDSRSGKQLNEINIYPKLKELISRMNIEFDKYSFSPLQFFCVEKPNNDYKNVLKIIDSTKKMKLIKLNTKIKLNLINID